jgi:DNA-binding MarR family transcriptional regulator
MGITRQSVQRIADLLVERGLAEYRQNPAHRTAKLLAPTDDGLRAVQRISPAHAAFAARLSAQLGRDEFQRVRESLAQLSAALDALEAAETG